MCNTWSGVVRRDGVCFSMVNQPDHNEIIEAAGLKADTADKDGMKFARVEITPPEGDYSLPLAKWVFRVDEKIKPTWLAAKHESSARRALKAWAREHIVRKGEREVKDGEFVLFIGRTTGLVSGGAAWFYDRSTGTVCGGKAWFYDHSTGLVGGGKVWFFDRSTGLVRGGKAWFHDRSTGLVSGGAAWFYDRSTGTVCGGEAWFYDRSTGTVYGGKAWFRDQSTRVEALKGKGALDMYEDMERWRDKCIAALGGKEGK